MRIGIDATFLESRSLHSGMGVYARGLVRAMAAEQPADVDIVLLGYQPRPAAAPMELAWHQLRRVPAGKLSAWLSHQVMLSWAARRLRLDLLHVPGVNVRLSLPGVPFVTACPLVVTLHDVIPLSFYNGRTGPRLSPKLAAAVRLALVGVGRAARVITVSNAARNDILQHTTLRPDRVVAIYNGLDQPLAASAAAQAALAKRGVPDCYLLYAGSFEPRKNFGGAVAGYAAAVRLQPDLPPLVALVERESGHRQAALAGLAASGVGQRVILVDSLPDAELWALYAGASSLVYPSLYEGFGFPPLQAMACGVPVIASRAGSLEEVLGDGALYVDPRQPDDIARALLAVLSEPARVAALRQSGAAVARRFSWQRCATQTLAVYRQAARAGG